MKALVIEKYGEKPIFQDRPMPVAGNHEVLIEIYAASLNPLDTKIRKGDLKLVLKYDMPLTLGNDFAGKVIQAGANVTKFKVGDEVYGRPRASKIGTFAEYLAVHEDDITLKPSTLDFAEAASVPLVGLTSYQALHDILQVKSGQKVLIHAGSGGVGTFAIQLAKSMGAFVATTASSGSELAKTLGADRVINYKQENFEDVRREYDAVIDTLGGATLEKSFAVLKDGGQVVSVSGAPTGRFAEEQKLGTMKKLLFSLASAKVMKLAKKHNTRYTFLFMKHSGEQLELLTKRLESKEIIPVIDKVFDFEDVLQALDYLETGRAKGKVVVRMK